MGRGHAAKGAEEPHPADLAAGTPCWSHGPKFRLLLSEGLLYSASYKPCKIMWGLFQRATPPCKGSSLTHGSYRRLFVEEVAGCRYSLLSCSALAIEAAQPRYCYGANRRASHPVRLAFSGVKEGSSQAHPLVELSWKSKWAVVKTMVPFWVP